MKLREASMIDQTAFYPFHAINEFMRPDFRLSMVRDVLNHLDILTGEDSSEIGRLINKNVKIPGFRNSEKAPNVVKILPTVNAFEKSPNLVAAILSGWAVIHPELQQQVYQLLANRQWQMLDASLEFTWEAITEDIIKQWPVLPPNVNRKRLPGFVPRWPKGEDFETLYTAFVELFPESDASKDQVSLMTVWITLRLPYEIEENEGETEIPVQE